MKNDNEAKTDLTYEKLKQYKGFENSTEEEAIKQIEIIKKLAKILYYMYMDEQQRITTKTNNYENRS
ncbi:MAG: hypothetical protein Q8L90_13845 [Bacteroidota bacterium]|nr:hypothetical protein [Bacteroidota bacterium]